jgi:hypothetical protein
VVQERLQFAYQYLRLSRHDELEVFPHVRQQPLLIDDVRQRDRHQDQQGN